MKPNGFDNKSSKSSNKVRPISDSPGHESQMLHRPDIPKLCWAILVLVIWLNGRARFAVQDQSSTEAEARQTTFVGQLEVGGVIEQELTGNEAHAYGLTLVSGQYVRVAVRQRGIDVL